MYIYDPTTKQLQTKAVRGPKVDCFSVPADKGIIGYVYRSRTGVSLRSPYEDPRFDRGVDLMRKSVTRNMICIPLRVGDTCVGCLEVANKRSGDGYSEQDYQLAQSVAKEIAGGVVALNSKHAFQDLGKESEAFRSRVGQVSGENLLAPLLKSVLIILTDILRSEK